MRDPRIIVLDAACAVVASSGVRELTLERVAKEAGMSLDDVTREFDDRLMLVRDAMDHADHRAMDTLNQGMAGRPTYDRLQTLLTRYIDDMEPTIRQDWIFWVEMEAASLFEEAYDAILRERADDWRRTLVTLIEVCQTEGRISPVVDAELAAARLLHVQDALGRQVLLGTYPLELARAEMVFALERELAAPV